MAKQTAGVMFEMTVDEGQKKADLSKDEGRDMELPTYFNAILKSDCKCPICENRRLGNLRLLDAPKKHFVSRKVMPCPELKPRKLF